MRCPILTVTLNAAIDRVLEAPGFNSGGLCDGRLVSLEPAGKGVNLARSLASLGLNAAATGFVGQPQLEFFRDRLAKDGVDSFFVGLPGNTRENITLIDAEAGKEAHIRERGLEVSEEFFQQLAQIIEERSSDGSIVCFAGSLPPRVTPKHFAELNEVAIDRGARVCVDTNGAALKAAGEGSPWLVKPNRTEFFELTGEAVQTFSELTRVATLWAQRIPVVLVSLGNEGAICATRQGVWRAVDRSEVVVKRTVGCGDALLAGFLAGYEENGDVLFALKLAVAAGSACAEIAASSLCSRDGVEAHLKSVTIEKS